jgi:hypothetical protein
MELARHAIVLAGASCVFGLAIGFLLGWWIGSFRRPAEGDLKPGFAALERKISSSQKETQNSIIQYLDKYTDRMDEHTDRTVDKQNEIIRLITRLGLEDLADALESKKIGTASGRSGAENRESSKETGGDRSAQIQGLAGSSSVVGGIESGPVSFAKASDVGERALALLDEGGRTSAIALVAGLEEWIRTRCAGFVAEPLLQSEGSWLIAVVSRLHENCGAVFPALDTVIGAGMILEWFECRGYDGTRVLQRKHVIDLAEAIRDQRGEPWRVKKKGLISREAAGGGA